MQPTRNKCKNVWRRFGSYSNPSVSRPASLLPSGLIRLSSKHFKDVMPVTNYNSFPEAMLVFKSREIFKCRMCHLGSRAKGLPAPPSSLKPGFAVEFDAVAGLLAISLHCFPHVPSPLRIWLQGINLETSIGSDRFASLKKLSQLSFESWAAPGFVALKRSISRKYSSMGLMAAMGEKKMFTPTWVFSFVSNSHCDNARSKLSPCRCVIQREETLALWCSN